MKKLLLILICLFVSFSTPSLGQEWKKVGETTKGSSYIDPDNIIKKNGMVFVWVLLNMNEPISGLWSNIHYEKIDCGERKHVHLSVKTFESPMGRGKHYDITEGFDKEWEYPRPGTIMFGIMKEVCGF